MSDEQTKPTETVDFFGPPPLLRGENEMLYFALHAEVERTINPKTILDRIDVRDITDKIWEAQRYKRFEARLIESQCVSALAHILAPIFGLDHSAGFKAANMYYGRDPLDRKVTAELLSHYHITDEMILAKALAQNSGHLAHIDRLIANRERSRNNVLKDRERRRHNAARLANMEVANKKQAIAGKADRIKGGKISPWNIILNGN